MIDYEIQPIPITTKGVDSWSPIIGPVNKNFVTPEVSHFSAYIKFLSELGKKEPRKNI